MAVDLSTSSKIVLRDNTGKALRPQIKAEDIIDFSFNTTNSLTHSNTITIGTIAGSAIKITAPSETGLAKGTTIGTGNAVTDVDVSEHTVTLTKGETFATLSQLDTLSSKVTDIENGIVGALTFKDTISNNTLPTDPKLGDAYIWNTSGTANTKTIDGTKLEPGDLIICVSTSAADDNGKWDVIQKNLDGAVTSTAALTSDYIVLGNGNQTVKASSSITESSLSNVISNSHGSASLVVSSTNTGTSNATINSATNTTAHINVKNGSTTTSTNNVAIKSGTKLTLTAASGVITLDHVSIAQASQNGNTSALNYGSNVITGVNTDGYGHITSFTVGTLPAQYVHPNSGVTEGAYGSSINVPQITVDEKGHITAVSNVSIDHISGVSVITSTGATTSLNAEGASSIILKASTNVELEVPTTGTDKGKILISAKDTTYSAKTNDAIELNGTVFSHKTYTAKAATGSVSGNAITIPVITVDNTGHVSNLSSATFTHTDYQGIQKITPSKQINATGTVSTYTTSLGGASVNTEVKLGTGLYLSTDNQTLTTGLYFEYVS